MKFTTSVVALFSVLSSTALAADVYSTFYNADGNDVASVNFDVSNTGCFQISGAVTVGFSQANDGGTGVAQGPYCLTGFGSSDCSYGPTSQQFAKVDVSGGTHYSLNGGVANVASYSWKPTAC